MTFSMDISDDGEQEMRSLLDVTKYPIIRPQTKTEDQAVKKHKTLYRAICPEED